MLTRTIKLKMVLPRSPEGRSIRRDLWTTHTIVNEAVKQIEAVLLLCRGDTYMDGEGALHDRNHVRSQAMAYARTIQQENGHPNEGTDEQILLLLRRLYESMVESAIKPGTGEAKWVRGFVRPLMSTTSTGGCNKAARVLDPLPEWVAMKAAGQIAWEAASQTWVVSSQAVELMQLVLRFVNVATN